MESLLNRGVKSNMRMWIVEFADGATVAVPVIEEHPSRDRVMMMARKILERADDWDLRQQSRGRIVKCYPTRRM